MKKVFVLCGLLLFGCSTRHKELPANLKGIKKLSIYSLDKEPATSIKLVRGVTFVAPKKYSIGWYKETVSFYSWLAGIQIDNAGRVYIADDKVMKIHVFNSDGKYLKSLGRKGRGPGEFLSIADMKIVLGKLYISDFLNFRTTIYSLDSLKVINTVNGRQTVNKKEVGGINGWVRSMLLLRSNGTFLAGFTKHILDERLGSPTFNIGKDRPVKFYFMNKKSKIISGEIFQIKKDEKILLAQFGGRVSSNIRPLPFLGRTIIAISNNNHIYITWTDNFLIKVYGADGNYIRAFYYPFRKKVIHRKELLSLINKNDWNRFVVEHAKLPKIWPVIYSMIVDDHDRLWVSVIVPQKGVREWLVLKDTGALIAKFTWPDNRVIKTVKDGYAYAIETNQETEMQKIVRYKIEMK